MRKRSGEGSIAGNLLEPQNFIHRWTVQGIVGHGGSKFSELYWLCKLDRLAQENIGSISVRDDICCQSSSLEESFIYLSGCLVTVIMEFFEVSEAKILHNALEDCSPLDLCEASEDSPLRNVPDQSVLVELGVVSDMEPLCHLTENLILIIRQHLGEDGRGMEPGKGSSEGLVAVCPKIFRKASIKRVWRRLVRHTKENKIIYFWHDKSLKDCLHSDQRMALKPRKVTFT